MTATFPKVSVTTLRSIVAAEIRKAILDGRLQPGERLVERKLSSQFGASLSVIREALVELEMEGFIVKQRNTATYVTRVTLAEAERVFQFRAVLEPYAMAEAAKRATAEDLRELRELYERMRECAAAGDLRAYLRSDYEWHERAWRVAGNEYVRASLARALVPFYAFFAIRCPEPPFDLKADAEAHLPILKALAEGDPAAAEAAVRLAMRMWRTRPASYADSAGGQGAG
jgi:DNA-binding GntR family transcriptional regulator